jgi:hypothetical protein
MLPSIFIIILIAFAIALVFFFSSDVKDDFVEGLKEKRAIREEKDHGENGRA